MIVGSFLFALMGVCVKYAAVSFNSAELIFYRGLISIVLLGGFARLKAIPLRTRFPAMHAWRSLIGVVAMGLWFYSIVHLPLATANALNYMSSIWIALFLIGGALMTWIPGQGNRRIPINGALVLSVVAGFGGVLLLLRPELPAGELFAGIIGLLSGLLAAFAYMQVVALSKVGESELRTVFYFAVGSLVGGAGWMFFTGVSEWVWSSAVWLLPIGVLAALGQWCITRAYADSGSHSATLVVANLQYSGILFSAVLGIVLFAEHISVPGWLGIAAIIGSGIAATLTRIRIGPATPGEER